MAQLTPSFKWRMLRLLVVVVVLVIATVIYYPYSPAGRQLRERRLGAEYRPRLMAAIVGDARFSKVNFRFSTSGVIMIDGAVRSEEDLQELRKRVDATQPPLDVGYGVHVIAPPGFDAFNN